MSTKKKSAPSLADVANTDRPASAKTPTKEQSAPATTERARPAGRARAAALVPVGVSYLPETMAKARSAYIADFRHRGQESPTSLDEWIGEAVRQLADMSVKRRASVLADLDPEPEVETDPATGEVTTDPATGKPVKIKRTRNKVRLSEDAVSRMDDARRADEEAFVAVRGRSTFVSEALRYGTERARKLHQERTGQTALPPAPPGRLPRRGKSDL